MRRRRGRAPLALLALAAACGGEPRGACDPHPPPGALGSVCGFRNPEDLAYAPSARLLLVSQTADAASPGALAGLALSRDGAPLPPPRPLWPGDGAPRAGGPIAGMPACEAPDPGRFDPHGIAVAAPGDGGLVRVAAVNHGGREAIEIFELDGAGADARLRWRGCLPLPAGARGNDVAFGARGALAVTQFREAGGALRALGAALVGGLGGDTGRVLRWRPDAGWARVAGSDGALPNGVALSADASVVYHARTGSGDVAATAFDAPPGPRLPAFSLSVGGHPDNLAWSPRGSLLVVTHLDGWRLVLCKLGRRPCRSAWALVEIDPRTLGTRERLRHDGTRLGGASAAAEVAGRFYFGAVCDDRIGVWRPPRS